MKTPRRRLTREEIIAHVDWMKQQGLSSLGPRDGTHVPEESRIMKMLGAATRPCPWCRQADAEPKYLDTPNGWCVQCNTDGCNAEGPFVSNGPPLHLNNDQAAKLAIERWNGQDHLAVATPDQLVREIPDTLLEELAEKVIEELKRRADRLRRAEVSASNTDE